MKFKIFFVFLIFYTACATIPKGKNILSFNIQPDKNIRPGTIIIVTVKTTEDVKEVYGSVEVPGSPKIPLKYDSDKKEWIFKYMIPVTFVLPKGEFTAKVEAITVSGEKSISEKKVSTY